MRLQAVLEQVETYQARTFATEDTAAAETIVNVDNVVPLFSETGTVTVDINGDEYQATPTNGDQPFITVDPPLAGAILQGDPIVVVPAAEVKWATVSFPGDDDLGDPTEYRVPYNLKSYTTLADGPKNGTERVAVIVETEPVPYVFDVPNEPSKIDGGNIDPDTTIPPGALTDGIPPADAPTDVATVGGLNLIFVKWTPITGNPDPVKYEVHVSTSAAFTPDESTLLTTTVGSLWGAKSLPNGTPFDYDTVYHFQVIATDADGAGPASAEVTGQMNRAGTDDIVVGSITADLLEAVLVLVTKITTALAGQRIEMDSDGIRSYDPSDNLLVDWSAATGLMSWKSAASGERVELDADGLRTSTTDPWAVASRSLAFGGNRLACIAVGSYIYAFDTVALKIRKFNQSDLSEVVTGGWPAAVPGPAIPTDVVSMAADATYLYLNHGTIASKTLRRFALSNGVESATGAWPAANIYDDIASDGTDLYVVTAPAAANYTLARLNASTLATIASVNTGTDLAPLSVNLTVGGGNVYVSSLNNLLVQRIRKFSASTLTQVTTGGWPVVGTMGYLAYFSGYLYAAGNGMTSGASSLGDSGVAKIDPANGSIVETWDAPSVRYGIDDIAPIAGALFFIEQATSYTGYLVKSTLPGDETDTITLDAATGQTTTYGLVAANATIDGLTVTRGAVIDTLAVANATVSENLAVAGDLTVKGNTVLGDASTDTVTTAGDLTVGDDLTVTDDATVGGDLSVTGATTLAGASSAPLLGHSDYKVVSTSVNATTTTAVPIPDLDMTVTVNGPTDVVWVELDATVRILTAGTISIVSFELDGVATSPSLTTELSGTGRLAGHKKWKVTGLSAGAHTIGFTVRNNAAGQSSQVQSTHSSACYWTST